MPYALNMGDAFSEYSGQACTGTWGAESKAGIAPNCACISFQKGVGRDFGCIPVCGVFMCNFVCTNFIKYVLPIIQMAKTVRNGSKANEMPIKARKKRLVRRFSVLVPGTGVEPVLPP